MNVTLAGNSDDHLPILPRHRAFHYTGNQLLQTKPTMCLSRLSMFGPWYEAEFPHKRVYQPEWDTHQVTVRRKYHEKLRSHQNGVHNSSRILYALNVFARLTIPLHVHHCLGNREEYTKCIVSASEPNSYGIIMQNLHSNKCEKLN